MATWLMLAVALGSWAADTAPKVTCVQVYGESRYRAFGYDHIAIVRNGCDKKAVCDVTTNVNPEPIRVEVPAGAAIEVLTFRGSPAREFVPRATCHL